MNERWVGIVVFISSILSLLHSQRAMKYLFEQYVEKSTIQKPYERDNYNGTSSTSSLSLEDIISEYVQNYNLAIENGKVKEGVRYVIYQCKEESLCGGVGDRVLGMVRAFYFAIATGRILLIDAPFPIPLEHVLNQNLVPWDAKVPLTTVEYDDMMSNVTLDERKNVTGYRLKRCQGINYRTLVDLLNEPKFKNKLKGDNQLFELSPASAFRKAFHVLFSFSPKVRERANMMKFQSGISTTPLTSTNNTIKTDSYVALHLRNGDQQMLEPKKKHIHFKRRIDEKIVLECYQTLQNVNQGKYNKAYLASDSARIKNNMRKIDPSIKFPKKMEIFHIDKGSRLSNLTTSELMGKVIDTWAELVVLIDSDCLILSNSMFSFLAYFIRDEHECDVHPLDCNEKSVSQNGNLYYYESGLFGRDMNYQNFIPFANFSTK